MPIDKTVDIGYLIEKTKNYTGADIENLCRETSLHVLRRDVKAKKISQMDFIETLEKFKPSVGEREIKGFEDMVKKTKTLKTEELTYFG